jgi:cytochrome c oxidase subunit 4
MSEKHAAHHHIVPIPIYLAIFATLLVMTGVTVAVAYVDFGVMNIVIALAIAAFKASLVVLFFMHVKYASKLTQLASVLGFVWLALLLGMTSSGIFTRDWVGAAPGWAMQPLEAGAAVQHEATDGAAAHTEEGEAPPPAHE